MKKTISINLGGYNFFIEEDAYETLRTYLDSVRKHFASYPDADEIVSDMETRMAEQLQSKGAAQDRPITKSEVDGIIEVMGTVEEFGEPDKNKSSNRTSSTKKRLYRNPDDVMIAGVASGLAAYFDVDPTLVRLIFGISVFFGGFGIFFYIALWIIVPEAKTPTEKLEMRGEPITLSSLEQSVREKVAEVKKNSAPTVKKAATVSGDFFRALGNVVRVLAMLVVKIIGLAIAVGTAVALAFLLFGLTTILFNANSPYVDFPVREFISGANYYILLFTAFFVALVPIVFVILAGASLVAGKSKFNKPITYGLISIWVMALIVGGALGLRLAPEIEEKAATSPYFQRVSSNFDVQNFKGVDTGGANRVTIHRGETFSIRASGRQADLDRVKFENVNGILKIRHQNPYRFCIFCINDSVDVEITMPELTAIVGSGAARFVSEDIFTTPSFSVDLSGASRAQLFVHASSTMVSASGASRIELSGTGTKTSVDLSGASRLNAETFETRQAELKLSGASQAYVLILDELRVDASGASKVRYQGSPTVYTDLSGSSKVTPDPAAPQPPEMDEFDF